MPDLIETLKAIAESNPELVVITNPNNADLAVTIVRHEAIFMNIMDDWADADAAKEKEQLLLVHINPQHDSDDAGIEALRQLTGLPITAHSADYDPEQNNTAYLIDRQQPSNNPAGPEPTHPMGWFRSRRMAEHLREQLPELLGLHTNPDGSLEVELPVMDASCQPVTVTIIPDPQDRGRATITDGGQSRRQNAALLPEILESPRFQDTLQYFTGSHGVTIEPDQTLTFPIFQSYELSSGMFHIAQAITAIETLRVAATLYPKDFQK